MADFSRRKFLSIATLGSSLAGLTAYSYFRGMRIPPLVWEPREPESSMVQGSIKVQADNAIFVKNQYSTHTMRAYAPKPSIELTSSSATNYRFTLLNVLPTATLSITGKGDVVESIDGINRNIDVSLEADQTISLSWIQSNKKDFTFAAIGDTGGGSELAWCLRRAHDLGADFLLHLGDINYIQGDFENAAKLFNNAPLPCFISIGNHDFHDKGPRYQFFLDNFGPLNFDFIIGKTHFVNIDTASSFIPYGSGHRARVLTELSEPAGKHNKSSKSKIGFTHRPLFDPIPDSEHHMGSHGERDWLIDKLKKANIHTLLSGHIHISDRANVNGIDNFIAGQGLGHQDLLTNSDSSKILLGAASESGEVDLQFFPLAMPMNLHCHPRLDVVKASSAHRKLISDIESNCSDS
jgi:hypothetical protein